MATSTAPFIAIMVQGEKHGKTSREVVLIAYSDPLGLNGLKANEVEKIQVR